MNDLFIRNATLLTRQTRPDVMEGYQTAPSGFSKAQSTGSIFRSMNDTMRDVYTKPLSSNNNQQDKSRKRSRSMEPENPDDNRDCDMTIDEHQPAVTDASSKPGSTFSRQIRPLRNTSRRTLLETRSLPANSFSFAESSSSPVNKLETPQEEDDWSQELENSSLSVEQPFEPMVL